MRKIDLYHIKEPRLVRASAWNALSMASAAWLLVLTIGDVINGG